MALTKDAAKILKATSRTFYIPISRLPTGLQEAVGSAYLCMRAIDEIEDHPTLPDTSKANLLYHLSQLLQSQTSNEQFALHEFESLFAPYRHTLPEVTNRVGEWACQAPAAIAPRVWDATAAMADCMAYWATNNWQIVTEADSTGIRLVWREPLAY